MAVPDPPFTAGCMQPSNELPNSICIVRLSAIGDVCHAVATVQAIQKHHQRARITWIIGRTEHNLVSDLPGIEFIVFDKRRGLKAYFDLYSQVKNRPPFDALLQMQTSFRGNLAGALIRARRKIGFPISRAREFHRAFVSEHLPETKAFHVLEGFAEFAQAIGVPAFEPEWDIPLPDSAIEHVSGWIGQDRDYVLMSPCASNPERNWLTDRYASIIQHCQNRGLEVVLTASGASEEIEFTEQIENLVEKPVINLAAKTSLKDLLALCRSAQLVIGPDSGTLHMATTQGTAVIGLYAHSDPRRTGPYGNLHRVADAYTPSLQALSKGSGGVRWGHRLKGSDLMHQIEVKEVAGLIDAALDDLENV